MEREWFDIGRHIVEGVAKGESGLQVFLAILVIVFGMVAKPAFEWLAERNRPLAITLSLTLLVFAIYMLISTWNYASEKQPITEEEPRVVVDSSSALIDTTR
jgi:uncharacterized membrane protein YoaK (UPF0700 family)